MASKPAIITQRDVTRIMRGAQAAGITMGIVVRNGEARFLPLDQIVEAAEPSALERWKANRAGETRGNS